MEEVCDGESVTVRRASSHVGWRWGVNHCRCSHCRLCGALPPLVRAPPLIPVHRAAWLAALHHMVALSHKPAFRAHLALYGPHRALTRCACLLRLMDDEEDGSFDVDAVQAVVNKVSRIPPYLQHVAKANASVTAVDHPATGASQVCNGVLIGPNQIPVPFQHAKVPQWTTTIVENVLKELAVTNSDAAKNQHQKFKYVGEQHSGSRHSLLVRPLL